MATETVAVTKEKVTVPKKQKSYFNKKTVNRFLLDDELSYIEHQPMDEGIFEAYQDLTSTIKLDQTGNTTEVDMALGKTRKFLLEKLVTGWNLVDGDGPMPFSHKALLELPPHVIATLVKDIYDKNQILSGEVGKET